MHGAVRLYAGLIKLYHLAKLGHNYVFFRYAHLLCKIGMLIKLLSLAMYGYEEFGLCKREHKAQFLAPRVAGNVHVRHSVVNNPYAALIKLIYHPAHAQLVTRYCGGGNYYRVPFAHVKLMRCVGHAEKPAHGFALAACGYYANLAVVNALELFHLNYLFFGDIKIAKLRRNLGYVHHAAPLEAYYPAKGYGNIRDLLNPVYV